MLFLHNDWKLFVFLNSHTLCMIDKNPCLMMTMASAQALIRH